ncbi:hypothetical protein J5277_17890 [Rhizobium sp. 16-449-1b]|uniref:hypothetical protein n=1 Tax=Rhizobium sp. 16-449-1b TaxID=2819989 RepID=UPI001ADB4C1A|nr:hypothetical protein [Rhizobium sp. 16-449-1b]MBO9195978.1 hypothetical protein [Rhizobium sp. 16-449-1b]
MAARAVCKERLARAKPVAAALSLCDYVGVDCVDLPHLIDAVSSGTSSECAERAQQDQRPAICCGDQSYIIRSITDCRICE